MPNVVSCMPSGSKIRSRRCIAKGDAGGGFDDKPNPFDSDAVFPAFAGIEEQRRVEGATLDSRLAEVRPPADTAPDLG